ncbi:MAG: hypothetical protein GEV10_31865 [Streptosporangiales bacterium]|nr:hypothetical protein [Streptosporangiales bacterium]
MALRFLCIDPTTANDNCPALFVDDETGDLIVQGWTDTDPLTLAEAAKVSSLAENETIVRLPARMRDVILEALRADGATVR